VEGVGVFVDGVAHPKAALIARELGNAAGMVDRFNLLRG
jgi:hypothetical protein